ncbi:hypothetical protein PUNSTDRAFT_46699 [Punctularia strigosozonata HHB-11173 SS5]|uniref:uncharacterized protein n=1 Tax=Punctularia strigosozonata (strain HHB-11173) TaxID=741275 RepID=UPI00044166C6|nr:uncharacterized protein PUNSTDRAFT_46699 [Punctularia strigosozonata HHB-11173 SS5]EIN05883.1 hypothetical protein PUNSTDRAFT_46699 [Punctularia strigosozonata HHB-11173 SS5]
MSLAAYHCEGLTNNNHISERLLADHGIVMKATTVKRHRNELGLKGSRATIKTMSDFQVNQLVANELDKDPSSHAGPATIKARLSYNEAIHIPCDHIKASMYQLAPEGFTHRDLNSKMIPCVPIVPLGINERWSWDRHDKLNKIGFQSTLSSTLQQESGLMLGLFLVIEWEIQLATYFSAVLNTTKNTTDCGSETTIMYGLVNALREIFFPEIVNDLLPAHVFLRSIHNIVIERSWLWLLMDFGNNIVIWFQDGETSGRYNPNNMGHNELSAWLWSKFIKAELAKHIAICNGM